jgi:leucine dehydrogenase
MNAMDIKQFQEYDNHNQVVVIEDKETGLKGSIAIHRNGSFKHAFGATRVWRYSSHEDAVREAMKLSKIMAYKSALAGLPYAGAKGVIMASSSRSLKRTYIKKYLDYVNDLQGKFITGSDVGVSHADVKWMREHSPYIVGVKVDPVKYTALGILNGIEVALEEVFGSEEVSRRSFAIQGLGKIGLGLLSLLYPRGAKIYACDVNEEQIFFIKSLYPKVNIVSIKDIYKQKVDVFSPCALSNCINKDTIQQLQCSIVLGGANSQLKSDEMGVELHRKGILYGPDYIVNAGGIIAVVDEFEHERISNERILGKVNNIRHTLREVIQKSRILRAAVSTVADEMARGIIDRRE